MKTGAIVGALALLGLAGGQAAAASCREDLAALEPKSQTDARDAIAHTSGGQAVAAEREAKPGPSTPAPSGSPADAAMQAKVSLSDAHAALDKGDEAGCEAAVATAKRKLGK